MNVNNTAILSEWWWLNYLCYFKLFIHCNGFGVLCEAQAPQIHPHSHSYVIVRCTETTNIKHVRHWRHHAPHVETWNGNFWDRLLTNCCFQYSFKFCCCNFDVPEIYWWLMTSSIQHFATTGTKNTFAFPKPCQSTSL